MAVITSIIAGITAAVSAISSTMAAIGGMLATPLLAIGSGGLAVGTGAATAATIGGGTALLSVGGALAGIGIAATAGLGLGVMYQSSRANAAAQEAQIRAIQQLNTETGILEVNKTANSLQDNSRVKRTLSSLRVPMGITPQQNEQVTQNVYGVDMNPITAATQNMTGLNIAAA